jgi:uncharacterized protein (UPF0332 family)
VFDFFPYFFSLLFKFKPISNKNQKMCATTYEDLPHEVRAMIWEYRTELRKHASTIIFRSVARNAIANRLSRFLFERATVWLAVRADQYSYGLLVYFRDMKVRYYAPRANAFLSDIRNLEIDYSDVYNTEEGDVDLTEIVRDAHQEFKVRFSCNTDA